MGIQVARLSQPAASTPAAGAVAGVVVAAAAAVVVAPRGRRPSGAAELMWGEGAGMPHRGRRARAGGCGCCVGLRFFEAARVSKGRGRKEGRRCYIRPDAASAANLHS